MEILPKQIIDFSGPEIKGTSEFFVSLSHGLKYRPTHSCWEVAEARAFIEYTLILEELSPILGIAQLAAMPFAESGIGLSSIVINGLVFAPEFAVQSQEFQEFKWPVPAEFFWKGENTIVTPLLPGSTAGALVREVSVQSTPK